MTLARREAIQALLDEFPLSADEARRQITASAGNRQITERKRDAVVAAEQFRGRRQPENADVLADLRVRIAGRESTI